MSKTVLITGGAGFIGQVLCRKLLRRGSRIRVLDNFSPQIHGANGDLSGDLKAHVELIRGDVRDPKVVQASLEGIDTVVHLAAETGTGQSMYEISRYFDVNVQGTANLLESIQNSKSRNLRSIVIASSRAVYGEGSYRCSEHGLVFPESRSQQRMEKGDFELHCPVCDKIVSMVPTEEIAPFRPMSIYGLTKQAQEQAVLMFARTKGLNAFGFRYQNVYGPGQSLKNPYTGILAIFSNLARQDENIDIYEDGLESRDFVSVDDVAEATALAVAFDGQFVGALNVGTGVSTPVQAIADKIVAHFSSKSKTRITGAFRLGDIRHNVADTRKLRDVLKFTPSVSFGEGLRNFLNWAGTQEVESRDGYRKSLAELNARGLMGERK